MRGRVWILLVLAGLAVLAGSVPVFRDNANETHAATYADVLKKRYPGWSGFSACLPMAVQGQLDCWGEIHSGSQVKLVESRAGVAQPVRTWTRALRKVPDQTLRTFGAGGTAVANAPGFDWGPMAGSLATATSFPATFAAGNSVALATAPPQIFAFTCRKTGAKVRCANAVGDLFLYTPPATE